MRHSLDPLDPVFFLFALGKNENIKSGLSRRKFSISLRICEDLVVILEGDGEIFVDDPEDLQVERPLVFFSRPGYFSRSHVLLFLPVDFCLEYEYRLTS